MKNKEFFKEIVNFMKESKYFRIAELITFFQNIEDNQNIIEYEYVDKEDGKISIKGEGKIRQWNINYDEEFPDMDIEFALFDHKNWYILYEMTDDNIKKINECEYVIDLKDDIVKLKTNL